MSAPQRGISSSQASMLGRIGSGLTPPKNGFRSVCSSRTVSLAVAQQAREPAGAGPVHRLDQDASLRGADPLEVDDAGQLRAEARVGIEGLHLPGRNGVVVVASRRKLVLGVAVHRRLDGGQHLRRRRAAVIGLDLEPVVGPWVVAGRDDDPGAGVQLAGEEAADLGGHRLGRREGADVVRRQHLDAGAREVLRGEAPVVADDHATVSGAGRSQVFGHAPGAAAHVVEREILGDRRAPAVGAELDLRHGFLGLECRASKDAGLHGSESIGRRSHRCVLAHSFSGTDRDRVERRLELGEQRPERLARADQDRWRLLDAERAERERQQVQVPPVPPGATADGRPPPMAESARLPRAPRSARRASRAGRVRTGHRDSRPAKLPRDRGGRARARGEPPRTLALGRELDRARIEGGQHGAHHLTPGTSGC